VIRLGRMGDVSMRPVEGQPLSDSERDKYISKVVARPTGKSGASISHPDVTPSTKSTGEPRKKWTDRLKSVAITGVVGLAAVETAGAIINEQINNQPASIRTIPRDLAWPWDLGKSAVEDIGRLFNRDVPSTFDNTAVSGIIAPSMFETIPEEEIDRSFPTPFKKIKDHNTTQILYPIDISTSKNPGEQIKYKRTSNAGSTPDENLDLEQKGFYNVFEADNVPPESTIIAPIDGMLMIYTFSGTSQISDHDYASATIDFLRPDGKEDRYIISGGTKANRGDVFRSLTNAPVAGWKMSQDVGRALDSKKIFVKRGTPILRVADNETMLTMYLRGTLADINQGKEITLPNGEKQILLPGEAPSNSEFLSTPEGKLLVPQK